MTETIVAALIGAAIALFSQWHSGRQADKRAARDEARAEREWQRADGRWREEVALADARREEDMRREEAVRQDTAEREDRQHQAQIKAARLRECWEHALESQSLMTALLSHRTQPLSPATQSPAVLPAAAAAQASAVALLGLIDVYPYAKLFYQATARLQMALENDDDHVVREAASEWHERFDSLEKIIAQLTGVIPRPIEPG